MTIIEICYSRVTQPARSVSVKLASKSQFVAKFKGREETRDRSGKDCEWQEVWGNPQWLISQEYQPIYNTDSDVARETKMTRDCAGTVLEGPNAPPRGQSHSFWG